MSAVKNVTALIERISGTIEGYSGSKGTTRALSEAPAPRQSRSFRTPGTLPGAREIAHRNSAISGDFARGIPDACNKGHSDKEGSHGTPQPYYGRLDPTGTSAPIRPRPLRNRPQ